MKNSKFDYYAYIVYASKDKKWGRWLQRKLRSYRLPQSRESRNEESLKRCLPVLHKKEILEEGGRGIRTAIERSKFLIVVCSHSVLSETDTVDEVIRRFIGGGAEPSNIIPFIVDNDRRPEQNCFPLELQKMCEVKTILGANIYDSGKYNAFLKAVAHMHGLKLEKLESEDSRRKKSMHKRIAVAACALIFILSFLAYRAWDYFVPHTKYYADYVERYGIPEGICELSGKEKRLSDASYAITSSRRKVRELRHEDQNGIIRAYHTQTDSDRPERATYEYSDNGELDEVIWYDENDNVRMKLDYINRKTIDVYPGEKVLNCGGEYITTRYSQKGAFKSEDSPVDNAKEKEIIRYLVDYDENGRVSELRYSSSEVYNTATPDHNSIWGLRFEHDELGRVTKTEYLVAKGHNISAVNPEYYEMVPEDGYIAMEIREYDMAFNLTNVIWTDAKGNKVACADGYSTIHLNYDGNHNIKEEIHE